MRKNLFITFCCAFVIALAALLFALPVSAVRAEVIGVNDKYYVGDVLDVSEVKISHDGNEYGWDSFRAVSSDGSVYDRGNIYFDDYGIWEIAFSTNIDGNLVETKKTVSVIKNYAVSSGRKAETTYTYNEKVGSYGLEMSIPIGETVELNYIVDVSKSDLRTSFIDFSFIPLEVGKADAYALYTDTSGGASNLNNIIEYAVEKVGSEKIFFGTDTYSCGFQVGRIKYARISDKDKENILFKNAKREFSKIRI